MNFDSFAQAMILQISDDIEESDENHSLELEYAIGVLTISTKKGDYILNKNSQMQELWLVSPISGVHHFRSKPGDSIWVNREKKDILQVLKNELFMIDAVTVIWTNVK